MPKLSVGQTDTGGEGRERVRGVRPPAPNRQKERWRQAAEVAISADPQLNHLQIARRPSSLSSVSPSLPSIVLLYITDV